MATLIKRGIHSLSNLKNAVQSNINRDRRIVVTGLGAVSPLGNDVSSSWMSLTKGESGIRRLEGTQYAGLPCQVAATIKDKELLIESKFSKSELKSMSSASVLALIASEEALNMAGLNEIEESEKENVGVSVGMGMLELPDIYNSYASLCKGYNRVSPYFIPRILPNMASGHISIKYGFKGPNHSVSTACATGAHAIGDAFKFIKYGDADIMVCGSGESCIDPLSIAGFCRLRALSTSFNDTPNKSSRPFDKQRDGFVMGEGAAIIILEDLEHAKKRNATIYAEILGYGLSGDANHLTAPSEDGIGATLAMKRALQDAGVQAEEISYVNAHATSTPTGDRIEAKSINNVFGMDSDVLVSSTKGAHGHLLGSSGNLESLFVILACKNLIIPPSINIENIDESINLQIVQSSQEWSTTKRKIALKNSFGFGGTNACLCISEFVE